MSTTSPLHVPGEVLPYFPALLKYPKFIYADNASRSQILQGSLDALASHYVDRNVQTRRNYDRSRDARRAVKDGIEAINTLVNAPETDKEGVVFASTVTQNVVNLAHSIGIAGRETTAHVIESNDEIIIAGTEHEGNHWPWVILAKQLNLKVRYWLPTPSDTSSPLSLALRIDTLKPLVSSNTRIVAFAAVSDILGQLVDVQEVVDYVRENSGGHGITVVDCTSCAPHFRVDMAKWRCDVVLLSLHKIYGPHESAMVIAPHSPLRLLNLPSVGQDTAPNARLSRKLEPGGFAFEGVAACTPIIDHLLQLGSGGVGDPLLSRQQKLDVAFDRIGAHEQLLTKRLLDYLTSTEARLKGVRVIGSTDLGGRAPIISFAILDEVGEKGFLRKSIMSEDIVQLFDEEEIAAHHGLFGAKRLLALLPFEENMGSYVRPQAQLTIKDGIKWDPDVARDGVVRLSFAHYNTIEEVDRIISVLKEAL